LVVRQGDTRLEGVVRAYLAATEALAGDFLAAEKHAREATTLLQGVPPVLPLALATLARALLGQRRFTEALGYAKTAHSLLDSAGGVDDGEALIRLVLTEAFVGVGDRQAAQTVLAVARQRLLDRASALGSGDLRAAFLEKIPEHARTLSLGRECGLDA
jgi:hypothetical protein